MLISGPQKRLLGMSFLLENRELSIFDDLVEVGVNLAVAVEGEEQEEQELIFGDWEEAQFVPSVCPLFNPILSLPSLLLSFFTSIHGSLLGQK